VKPNSRDVAQILGLQPADHVAGGWPPAWPARYASADQHKRMLVRAVIIGVAPSSSWLGTVPIRRGRERGWRPWWPRTGCLVLCGYGSCMAWAQPAGAGPGVLLRAGQDPAAWRGVPGCPARLPILVPPRWATGSSPAGITASLPSCGILRSACLALLAAEAGVLRARRRRELCGLRTVRRLIRDSGGAEKGHLVRCQSPGGSLGHALSVEHHPHPGRPAGWGNATFTTAGQSPVGRGLAAVRSFSELLYQHAGGEIDAQFADLIAA
jgi:hypothetical protein